MIVEFCLDRDIDYYIKKGTWTSELDIIEQLSDGLSKGDLAA